MLWFSDDNIDFIATGGSGTPLSDSIVRGNALITSPPAGARLFTGSFKFLDIDKEMQVLVINLQRIAYQE